MLNPRLVGEIKRPVCRMRQMQRQKRSQTPYPLATSRQALETPPCYFCNGDLSKVFANAEDEVEFHGLGTYACWEVMFAGTSGFIAEELCPMVQSKVEDICHCVDAPEGGESPSTDAACAVPEWTPDQGIFELFEDNGVTRSRSQEFESGPYAPVNTQVGFLFSRPPLLYIFFSESEPWLLLRSKSGFLRYEFAGRAPWACQKRALESESRICISWCSSKVRKSKGCRSSALVLLVEEFVDSFCPGDSGQTHADIDQHVRANLFVLD
jgi:hypothetical protein